MVETDLNVVYKVSVGRRQEVGLVSQTEKQCGPRQGRLSEKGVYCQNNSHKVPSPALSIGT